MGSVNFAPTNMKSTTSRKRTYLDPVHQDITLDGDIPEERLIIDLIDSKEFQRLRRIQQLGVASFTFQGRRRLALHS